MLTLSIVLLLPGIFITWTMVRTGVASLQRQCCRQICRCGIEVTECAVQQLPVFMAPALLAAATRSQLHDVASCIVSNWPLPVLRYVALDTCRSVSFSSVVNVVVY